MSDLISAAFVTNVQNGSLSGNADHQIARSPFSHDDGKVRQNFVVDFLEWNFGQLLAWFSNDVLLKGVVVSPENVFLHVRLLTGVFTFVVLSDIFPVAYFVSPITFDSITARALLKEFFQEREWRWSVVNLTPFLRATTGLRQGTSIRFVVRG